MRTGDFASLFIRAVQGVAVVMAFAAGAATDLHAASSAPVEFATSAFLSAPAAKQNSPFDNRFDVLPNSIVRDVLDSPALRAPVASLTPMERPRKQRIIPAGNVIVGIASSYNPGDPKDRDSGTMETASGERYDAEDWTAAIRTDLRAQFGGVRFGKNYQAAFALVDDGDKRAIVRINDVGPLRKGRIIDLNERTMRYFDPTMHRGLITNFRVTPLVSQDVAVGPVIEQPAVNFASRFDASTR